MHKTSSVNRDTIIALATSSGVGAIAVIRLSGLSSIEIVDRFFRAKLRSKRLTNVNSHTVHLGHIVEKDRVIDEVLVTVFKNPHSYTGEDVIEISCHGSVYIQNEILQLFLKNGIRHADAGEFTLRAFINGKLDLSQAEAVADLIASDSKASHQIAMQQMRGGFSSEIASLRDQLLNFASLIELELDFSEEDVEFADRARFQELLSKITSVLKQLIDSFTLGNVFKNGIPVAIIGEPNVGKSTLLNALVKEEKAIVSEIAGTTRDAIEDEIIIEGVAFRFIDTAGIRETQDIVENIGIQKTYEKIDHAQLVLLLLDTYAFNDESNLEKVRTEVHRLQKEYPDKNLMLVFNKVDLISKEKLEAIHQFFELEETNFIDLSAKNKTGIIDLKNKLTELANIGVLSNNETIISNSRHFEALYNAFLSILEVQKGVDDEVSSDLFTVDIHRALYHLGEITGEITTEDLLGNIFSNFCIGK